MKCREARKFLAAFADNELDVRTNIEVLEHVEMCPACSARLERLQNLNQTVKSYIDSVRAPADLRPRVTEALDRAGMEPLERLHAVFAAHKGWFRIALAAASILVVFAVVYQYLVVPPAVYNQRAIRFHTAAMQDKLTTFFNTDDPDRALKLALFKMGSRPEVPLLGNREFQLVGAGPEEVELKNVGHFAFLYNSATISMFVFEGVELDQVSGTGRTTHLGPTRVETRGDFTLVAWQKAGFTYILVSQLPEEQLISLVGAGRDQ
ncbi:MAG: anti-sigma factor family protein [Planctomycetota bacterium]|jgi:anti-sigma factor RsiW